MAYIYQITNDINKKSYIGKTQFSIEKRFKQHCKDSKRRKNQNRPLYRAMNKYGIEHFHIKLLEETNNPEEREKYWINKKDTYKNGYNATKGGDGKRYLDYNQLIEAYKKEQNISKISKKYHCDAGYLSKILKENGIKVLSSSQIAKKKSRPVNQYSLNGQFIKTFLSAKEAIREGLHKTDGDSHIRDVCKGKRKTAYGYIWKYADQQKII